MNKKLLLTLIICALISVLMFSLIACGDKVKPDTPPEVDENEIVLTSSEIFEAAAAWENPLISVSIFAGEKRIQIYNLQTNGSEWIHPDVEDIIDTSKIASPKKIYSYKDSNFMNVDVTNVVDQVQNRLTATVRDAEIYFDTNNNIRNATVSMQINVKTKKFTYINFNYQVVTGYNTFYVEIHLQ